MKILAVNWLDTENPQAGGAEVHFFEIFRRLVRDGAGVTLVTSGWDDAESAATLDGIRVLRYGGRHTFALRGRGAVRAALRDQPYDVVVEDINKLPLFLASVTDLPLYVIVPHLFGAAAFHEAVFPIATAVWLAERAIPGAYRRAAFHAISRSTRDDLVKRGVRSDAVRVIFPGVDTLRFAPSPGTERASQPTFLYVGRLKRYKGIDVALRAIAGARQGGLEISLDIAGEGDDRSRLERLAARLDLGAAVRFLGFISEEEKLRLLRRAWAVVLPSVKEGWGITNVEAAACGTPAIAADRPGLRESVLHEKTGYLVPYGDHEALARVFTRLAAEPQRVGELGRAARSFAEGLSWDRAAAETKRHLQETVTGALGDVPATASLQER